MAMVAGEPSGDLLAALLLSALKRRIPDLSAYGIGGPRMEAEGFRAQWPIDRLAVRGYVEVLRHLFEIVGIRRALKRRLLHEPPAAFVGIDAPDFNLGLEIQLREVWRGQGRPVVHFISPSDLGLARRPHQEDRAGGRPHARAASVRGPRSIIAPGSLRPTWGHPLADVIPLEVDRSAARARLGLPTDARVIAILPGSRVSEIEYNAGTFLDAAAIIATRHPDVRFVVPMAGAGPRARFDGIARRHTSSR